MARTSSAAAFCTASRSPSTSSVLSALRRCGRCSSRVVTWPSRVTPIMGPPYIPAASMLFTQALIGNLAQVSRIGAVALRDAVLDAGSFRSWDTPPLTVATSDEYRRELAAASTATGLDESVLTGEGRVYGRRVAVVACEFDFLAGPIGVAAAERITAAVARATAERLALFAFARSRGARRHV